MKKICGYLLPEGKYCTLPSNYPHGAGGHHHEPAFAGADAAANSKLEAACEFLHNAYEAAAVEFGWSTQAASAKPWSEVPEANKQTMRAAVVRLLGWLGAA